MGRGMKRGMLLLTGALGSALVIIMLVHSAVALWQPEAVQTAACSVQSLTLPVRVPGTTLMIHNLVSYEGGYLESESREFVSDVAAVLLENTGTLGIESARVILEWDAGAYVFDVDMLPPGMQVIVLERGRQPYSRHTWTSCDGVQKVSDEDWFEPPVQVAREGDTKLQLFNGAETDLQNVCIYYKDYLEEDNILLGGITYSYCVPQLPSGCTVTVEPYRFVWGCSRIVGIAVDQRNEH